MGNLTVSKCISLCLSWNEGLSLFFLLVGKTVRIRGPGVSTRIKDVLSCLLSGSQRPTVHTHTGMCMWGCGGVSPSVSASVCIVSVIWAMQEAG